MLKRRLITGLFTLLCLAACAPKKPEVLLTNEIQSKLTSTLVLLVIDQKALDVKVYNDHTASTAMMGGLIPALIDAGITSYRKNNALDDIKPLQAYVDTQATQTMFTDAIGNAIRSAERVPVKEVVFSDSFTNGDSKQWMTNYGVDSLLVVDVDYMVHANYRTMYGGANLQFIEKNGGKPLPKKKIYDTSSFLEPAAKEDLISQWSANDGKLLQTHLHELANGMADIIRISLLTSEDEGE